LDQQKISQNQENLKKMENKKKSDTPQEVKGMIIALLK
jgi:hypothetical protein